MCEGAEVVHTEVWIKSREPSSPQAAVKWIGKELPCC